MTEHRRIRETPFWQAYDRRRYGILFYALLLTLAVMPAAPAIGLPPILIKLLPRGQSCGGGDAQRNASEPIRFFEQSLR